MGGKDPQEERETGESCYFYVHITPNKYQWLPFFLSKSSTMIELMVKMLNVVANVATAEMETSLKKFSQSWSFNDDAG